MKKLFYLLLIIIPVFAISGCSMPNSKVLHNGEKWNVAYLEGGEWGDYTKHLLALFKGLESEGWIKLSDKGSMSKATSSRVLWDLLCDSVESDYIRLEKDNFWSSNWSDETRAEVKSNVIRRLKSEDIDMVIAAGTWAGQDLANDKHSVPTIVISTSDPIRSKIISSAKDSGFDHVHALCDPDRYPREIRAFYNLVKFDTLGVVYDDTEDGRIWSYINELEDAKRELGFDIVKCQASEYKQSAADLKKNVMECYEKIAPQIDALWIGSHKGQMHENMPEILLPMFEHKVAVWSVEGNDAVRRGALLSVSEGDLKETGLFYAQVITDIFNGKKPRDINQVFVDPVEISINLETAERIGYKVPQGLFTISDNIFNKIEYE